MSLHLEDRQPGPEHQGPSGGAPGGRPLLPSEGEQAGDPVPRRRQPPGAENLRGILDFFDDFNTFFLILPGFRLILGVNPRFSAGFRRLCLVPKPSGAPEHREVRVPVRDLLLPRRWMWRHICR